MKITIDTQAKTITVETAIKLGELTKELEKMLPDWQEYSIHTAPVRIEYIPYPQTEPYIFQPSPLNPPWTVTYGDTGASITN